MEQGTAAAAEGLIGTAYPVPRDRKTPNFRDGYMYLSPSGRRCFYKTTTRGDDLHFVYARSDGRMPKSPLADGFTLKRSLSHLLQAVG
jgi:hypothetical protein